MAGPIENRAALLAVASDWYTERRRSGALPDFRTIDPRRFPSLMPWCLLVSLERDLMLSRVLICGTGVGTVVHQDWTGKRLGEISLGAIGNRIFEPFERTIAAREPLLVRERRKGHGDIWRWNDRLMLPYGAEGSAEVERLLSITLFLVETDRLMWPTSIDAWEVVEYAICSTLLDRES